MRPRPSGRGDGIVPLLPPGRQSAAIGTVVGLWNHRSADAVPRDRLTAMGPRPFAREMSMGPCHRCELERSRNGATASRSRGDLNGDYTNAATGNMPQWGHGSRPWKRARTLDAAIFLGTPQWGHGHGAVETRSPKGRRTERSACRNGATAVGAVETRWCAPCEARYDFQLQWGHGRPAVEAGIQGRRNHPVCATAMGPRPAGRGDNRRGEPTTEVVWEPE
jgi:hypothetical protein